MYCAFSKSRPASGERHLFFFLFAGCFLMSKFGAMYNMYLLLFVSTGYVAIRYMPFFIFSSSQVKSLGACFADSKLAIEHTRPVISYENLFFKIHIRQKLLVVFCGRA